MYCVYMSEQYLKDEIASELYGEFIDENYQWREELPVTPPESADETPDFLKEKGDVETELLTGEGRE